MELRITNLARISDATVALRGLTVIAGPNGTGKSTISRAAMVLKTLNRNLPTLVAFERVSSIIRALQKVASEAKCQLFRLQLPAYDNLGTWSEFLQPELWRDRDAVREWISGHFFSYLKDNTEKKDLGILVIDAKDPNAQLSVIADRFREEALKILHKDIRDYERHACMKVLNTAFSGQWLPYENRNAKGDLRLSSGNRGCLIAYEHGEIAAHAMPGVKEDESWIYFEPYHILDFVNDRSLSEIGDRYVADGISTLNLLARKVPTDNTLEQQSALNRARPVLDQIKKILGGCIHDNQDGQLSFRDEQAEQDPFDVSILNIASGMKTLSALYRSIENGSLKEHGFLIIDEPESNLHPEWQIAFARVLVAVRVELDVTILVTTHSPYFMRALEVFMSNVDRSREFEAYLMERDEYAERAGLMKANRVTDSVEKIYREMYLPIERIKTSNMARKS